MNDAVGASTLGRLCERMARTTRRAVCPGVPVRASCTRSPRGGRRASEVALRGRCAERAIREMGQTVADRNRKPMAAGRLGVFDQTHLRWFGPQDAMDLVCVAGVNVRTIEPRYRLDGRGLRLVRLLARTRLAPLLSFQTTVVGTKP